MDCCHSNTPQFEPDEEDTKVSPSRTGLIKPRQRNRGDGVINIPIDRQVKPSFASRAARKFPSLNNFALDIHSKSIKKCVVKVVMVLSSPS